MLSAFVSYARFENIRRIRSGSPCVFVFLSSPSGAKTEKNALSTRRRRGDKVDTSPSFFLPSSVPLAGKCLFRSFLSRRRREEEERKHFRPCVHFSFSCVCLSTLSLASGGNNALSTLSEYTEYHTSPPSPLPLTYFLLLFLPVTQYNAPPCPSPPPAHSTLSRKGRRIAIYSSLGMRERRRLARESPRDLTRKKYTC